MNFYNKCYIFHILGLYVLTIFYCGDHHCQKVRYCCHLTQRSYNVIFSSLLKTTDVEVDVILGSSCLLKIFAIFLISWIYKLTKFLWLAFKFFSGPFSIYILIFYIFKVLIYEIWYTLIILTPYVVIAFGEVESLASLKLQNSLLDIRGGSRVSTEVNNLLIF